MHKLNAAQHGQDRSPGHTVPKAYMGICPRRGLGFLACPHCLKHFPDPASLHRPFLPAYLSFLKAGRGFREHRSPRALALTALERAHFPAGAGAFPPGICQSAVDPGDLPALPGRVCARLGSPPR